MSYKSLGRRKGLKTKLLCLLTVLTVLIGSMPMTAMATLYLSSEEAKAEKAKQDQIIADLQQQYNDLQSDRNDARAQLDIIAESIPALEKQQEIINQQLAMLDQQIQELDGKVQATEQEIDDLNAKIAQLEADLSAKETQVDNTYEMFMQRMRAIYMSGEVSSLTMFFNSGDFADYLYQAEVKQRLAEQDKQLVDTLRTQIEEMNATKADVETSQKTLSAKMDDLQAARAQLQADQDEQREAKQALEINMADLEALRIEQKNKLDEAEEKQRLTQEGIEKATDIKNSIQVTDNDRNETPVVPPVDEDPSAMNFIWPVPGYDRPSNISSPYGNRVIFGRLEFHTGIDIAGYGDYGHIAGKTIVAAEDGVVTIAKNNGQWNYGWGNYVSIDHGINSADGKRYETFYGHTQTVLVSVGQYVTKGTPIALVGTSGNSTGYHLHFEVRANNQYQNPMNYVHTR